MPRGKPAAASNPVLDVLLELAQASFPDIFLPDVYAPSGRPPPPSTLPGSAAWGERSRAVEDRFAEAIRGDPDLHRFEASTKEHGEYIAASTGVGWRVQLRDLAPSLVTSAATNVLLKQGPTHRLEPLLEEVEAVLAAFRGLVRGETGQAIALTGFEGFRVPPGVRVVTPWGDLRQANNFESQFRPFGPTTASAVLETRIPLRLRTGEPARLDDDIMDNETATNVGRAGGLIALALVLATPEESSYMVGDAIWQTTIVPGYASEGFVGRIPRPRFTHTEPRPPALSEQQIRSIEEWSQRVHDHYDPAVDIAVRRTVSAIRERMDPEDAIIDAVVAWENLFGHQDATTEVTFRVTTAIARLLEDDLKNREELRASLAKIYATRSRVIHGAPMRAGDRLADKAARAIDVAVRSLRRLFGDRPELIRDRKRGMRILLEP